MRTIKQWSSLAATAWLMLLEAGYNNIWIFQVLGFLEEFGGLSDEFYEVYYQPALPPFPLHCSLCSTWNAAFWWQVSI